MLVLLLCAVLGEVFQPGVISQAASSLFSRNERTYRDAPVNFPGQLMMTLFRIGTIGMGLYLCLYTDGEYWFSEYAALCGVILVVLVGKMLCNGILDYTFQISRRFSPAYEQYGDITTIVSCILYPALLVSMRIGSSTVNGWILGSVAVVFILLWLFRLTRNYIQSPMAIVYVVLYICTLEVLPMGLLFYFGSKTISII